jgi:hypothetical protein
MATQTAVITAVERGLNSLTLMLDDLPAVAEEWNELGEAERASWSLDWDQEMGALQTLLVRSFDEGHMDGDEGARYRALWGQISAALPAIRQLGLSCPPMILAPS